MPLREFVDSHGVSWRVWSTLPTSTVALTGGFERGWLTFECRDGLRRLAPIPDGWEHCVAERLELLCRAAEDVPRSLIDPDGSRESAREDQR